MADKIALTVDEIRTGYMIAAHYRDAAAKVAQATQMEEEFFYQLRQKYGLDESWTCHDLLDGFIQIEQAGANDQDN